MAHFLIYRMFHCIVFDMPSKKYFIITFGCQMNESDSERLAAVLEQAGYIKALSIEKADIVAYNTCSVRQTAEDRVFGANKVIAALKKKNPRLTVMLTGCMVHYGKKELKKRLPKFDLFLDIKDIPKLPTILGINKKTLAKEYLDIRPSVESPFSAFVPISYGCNNYCSYCIVPLARGGEYSRPAKEIIAEVKNYIQKGYKEIWLLGQNVNSYGIKDKTYWANKRLGNKKPAIEKGRCSFSSLIKEIDKIPGLPAIATRRRQQAGDWWLRFTSPHPKDLSDELIQTLKNARHFAHYINLPMQAGDDTILKKMNRHYTARDYLSLIKKIRAAMPNVALSTDIIVGFPGETQREFQNTARVFAATNMDMAYISKYSPRPQTVAAKKYTDSVPLAEKKKRFDKLNAILKRSALAHNKRYLGKTMTILIDKADNGTISGKTATYKTVETSTAPMNAKKLLGTFVDVTITKVRDFSLEGIIKR
jgi:tRNA-2-methylthio-N6-dimethylallyladenosine synthase